MTDSTVFAVFEPTEAELLSTFSQVSFLVDNPILASALSNTFPYLLLIDNFLEVITWTNENPYKNLLLMTAFSVVVLCWTKLAFWLIPILTVSIFLSVVWTTSSVIYDSKFDEKPTVDEVLRTIHNMTVRFELLLRPARNLNLTNKNYVTMMIGAIIFTPLHLLIMKFFLLPQTFTWLVGVFMLTYHSPYAFSSRRLFWRSTYVRRGTSLVTGILFRLNRRKPSSKGSRDTISREKTHNSAKPDICEVSQSITNKAQMINDFTITQKTSLSTSKLSHIVRFDILENERRWIGIGWSKYLFPNERTSFCYATLMLSAPDPSLGGCFRFPVFENDLYNYQWQWMDYEWKLDPEFDLGKNKEGWVYYDSNWEKARSFDGFSRYTRSRKWTRRAVLLIDKRAEVYDA